MLIHLILACLAVTSSAAKVSGCAYENCFFSRNLPSQYQPAVTKFCQYVIGRPAGTTTITTTKLSTATSTPTTTTTRTLIIDLLPVTTTVTVTLTTTVVRVSTTTVTSTTTPSHVRINAATFVDAGTTRSASVRGRSEDIPRNVISLPACLLKGCRDRQPPLSKVKSACSCFLPYTTVTRTQTGTITVIGTPSTVFVDVTFKPPPPTYTTTVTTTTSVFTTTVSTITVANRLAARTITEITRCGTSFDDRPTATKTGTLAKTNAASSSSSSSSTTKKTTDSSSVQARDLAQQMPRVFPHYGIATAGKGFIRVRVTVSDIGTPMSELLIAGIVTDVNGYADIPVPSVPGCYQYQVGHGGISSGRRYHGGGGGHDNNENSDTFNTFHLSVFEQFYTP